MAATLDYNPRLIATVGERSEAPRSQPISIVPSKRASAQKKSAKNAGQTFATTPGNHIYVNNSASLE